MDAEEKYIRHAGKYPVIKLSLKAAKQKDFDTAYDCLKGEIAKEYRRHILKYGICFFKKGCLVKKANENIIS